MNLQTIATNFQQFPAADLSGWGSPLGNVLEALFKEHVELHYSANFEDLLPRERLAIHTVFDMPHDSDEACELHILVVDGKPVGAAHKFADKSSWNSHIIDAEQFKTLARDLAIAALDERLAQITADSFDSLSSLKNGYLHFLGEGETMFAVNSPKGMYGFSKLPEKHPAFYVDATGAVHPVTAIGKFANKEPSHSSKRTVSDVFITVGGKEFVVDGSELMFELVPGSGNIEAALRAYNDPPTWIVGDVFPGITKVVVYQCEPMRRAISTLWVTFKTVEDYDRFVAENFQAEGEHKIFPGTFDLAALGYTAHVQAD